MYDCNGNAQQQWVRDGSELRVYANDCLDAVGGGTANGTQVQIWPCNGDPQQQWTWGPRVSASQVEPGDLVFFAGSDGTVQSPGHVGLVIGGGKMIEAYATGFPIRIAPYGSRDPVGFTRPWAHSGVTVTSAG